MRENGFTLTELILGIAITGGLIGTAVAAAQQHQTRAHNIRALECVRSIKAHMTEQYNDTQQYQPLNRAQLRNLKNCDSIMITADQEQPNGLEQVNPAPVGISGNARSSGYLYYARDPRGNKTYLTTEQETNEAQYATGAAAVLAELNGAAPSTPSAPSAPAWNPPPAAATGRGQLRVTRVVTGMYPNRFIQYGRNTEVHDSSTSYRFGDCVATTCTDSVDVMAGSAAVHLFQANTMGHGHLYRIRQTLNGVTTTTYNEGGYLVAPVNITAGQATEIEFMVEPVGGTIELRDVPYYTWMAPVARPGEKDAPSMMMDDSYFRPHIVPAVNNLNCPDVNTYILSNCIVFGNPGTVQTFSYSPLHAIRSQYPNREYAPHCLETPIAFLDKDPLRCVWDGRSTVTINDGTHAVVTNAMLLDSPNHTVNVRVIGAPASAVTGQQIRYFRHSYFGASGSSLTGTSTTLLATIPSDLSIPFITTPSYSGHTPGLSFTKTQNFGGCTFDLSLSNDQGHTPSQTTHSSLGEMLDIRFPIGSTMTLTLTRTSGSC